MNMICLFSDTEGGIVKNAQEEKVSSKVYFVIDDTDMFGSYYFYMGIPLKSKSCRK